MPTQQQANNVTDPVEPPQPAAPAEPGGDQGSGAPQEPPAIDWKAEAERFKKESRKWEARAKENKDKADLWDAQGAQTPTVESLNDELNDLKGRLAASEAERERERVREVAQLQLQLVLQRGRIPHRGAARWRACPRPPACRPRSSTATTRSR